MGNDDDVFLTPRQAAERFLGDPKRERTIRHFYERHGLPVVRVGASVLIKVADLKAWLARHRDQAA